MHCLIELVASGTAQRDQKQFARGTTAHCATLEYGEGFIDRLR